MRTGRPKRLNLEERIELARRYHAGETPKGLAEAFGISRRHVTRLAKEEQGDGLAERDPSERVSFRASRSELEAFDAEWQARGFANRSQALHAMLRARCGFLDVPRDQIVAFSETCRQAQDVTDAGRGLAKAVHRGKLALSSGDLATLSALLDTAQVMSRELAAMKETARQQRGQGWPKPDKGGAPDRVEKPAGRISDQNAPRRTELDVKPHFRPPGSLETRLATGPDFVARRKARYG